MFEETNDIPPGYRKDAVGNLVPESNIKEIDKTRDEVVTTLVQKAMTVANQVAAFKTQALRDIEAFVAVAAMDYDVQLGGKKGNVTLVSFDGRYKITRAINESITFNEQLVAAKELIDQCLLEWTKDSSDYIKALVNNAFEVNSTGEISTTRVLGLRRIDIDDARWLKAMEAISNSVMVTGSKTYIRIYERIGDADEYRQISLNGSGV